MLRNMAEHGDDQARETIASTLLHSAQIVVQREYARVERPTDRSTRPLRRLVYDARHKRTLPGKLVASERTRIIGDIEAKEAFDASGATHHFFFKRFGRNSIDGRGMPLISTVHYGRHFDNAMWDGKQMVYGDGDGTVFTRFTSPVDVVAHELTHGMTEFEVGLAYHGQPGALNEHLSDAFGIMVKQHWLGLTAGQSDWYIGEGLLGPAIQGKALRSMKALGTAYDDPILGRDPQPAHMRDYVHSADDNGGVHINSGIPNHAFYLAATDLGGYAWEVMGELWYYVLTTTLFPNAGFQDFVNATVVAAGDLYGAGRPVQRTVAGAWSQVGLPVPAALVRRQGDGRIRAQKWRNRPLSLTA